MASVTKVYKCRKKLKKRKAGARRKKELAKCTTPARAVFFGDEISTPGASKAR